VINPAPKYPASVDKILWYGSLGLLAYMPFHVFLSISLSTVTGGLDAWKAAKDVVLYLLAAVALYILVRRGTLKTKSYQRLAVVSVLYVLLHLLLLLVYGRHTLGASVLGIVFNARVPAALCIGMALAVTQPRAAAFRQILKVMLVASLLVAAFGAAQYVLPKNMLAHVGYTPARGVKAMFYIDDKPDLPRVMSTMRDPNTLGAFLLLPMLLLLQVVRKARPRLRKYAYSGFALMLVCLLLTYSRSALLGLLLALGVYGVLVHQKTLGKALRRYWLVAIVLCLLPIGGYMATKNTYFVKNTVLHEDQSTKQEGSNGLHRDFAVNAIRKIVKQPWGYGPGTAGLVSIRSTQVTLTENYYLQIGIEVGVLGLFLFLLLNYLVAKQLLVVSRSDGYAAAVLAVLVGLAFINTLLHMWSGEAVVLYWWLLAGMILYEQKQKKGPLKGE
jgi:O-antigen ligase